MKDLAIICSLIPARHALLQRSLQTWKQSIDASGLDCHIYIWSEGVPVEDLLYVNSGRVPNVTVTGQEALSGSHIKGYNAWLEQVQARTYLFTHPDLLYPKDTVATAFANAVDDTFVAFKCFWMSPDMTRDIDHFNWHCPEVMEQEKMLYELDPLTHGGFYQNAGIRDITNWESSTTYAINRQTAEKMYPLPDFGTQGPDDPYQAGLRQRLSIKNYTVMEPILFHQWHPSTWFGTGEEAVAEASKELQKRFKK